LKLKKPLIAGLRFTTSQLNDVLIELIQKEYGKSDLGIELMNIPTGGEAFNEVTAN